MEHIAGHSSEISVGDAESVLALGAGAALLLLGTSRRSVVGSCVALASVPFFYRGVTGRWPDADIRSAPRDDTRVALAGSGGVHVRESVRVEAPVDEIYRFWRRLENLPRFMKHVTEVRETSDRTSHWVAEAPGGLVAAWDAEIINDEPGRLIAWRSIGNPDIDNSGSVRFVEVPDIDATEVSVTIDYIPPAGRVGAWIAKLFGEEPQQQINDDLRRFKQLMETGEISTTENQPRGRCAAT